MWQGIFGCVLKFFEGWIFFVGDVVYIFVLMGGMGNNIGFVGIWNFIWKLVYVIQGYVSLDILEMYEEEMKFVVMKCIVYGLNIM